MKETPCDCRPVSSLRQSCRAFITLILLGSCFMTGFPQTLSIQVKVFNKELDPMSELSLALNGGSYFVTNKKGISFIDVKSSDVPPVSVQIKHDKLEAESWNYSRGVLEIIVREKRDISLLVYVRNGQEELVKDLPLRYDGSKRFTPVQDNNGYLFTLPLGEDVKDSRFALAGYDIVKITKTPNTRTLHVLEKKGKQKPTSEEAFDNFNLANLDTVRTWQTFYKILKYINTAELTERERQLLDTKFNELARGVTAAPAPADKYIRTISDSSQVKDDIRALLAHADQEKTAIAKMDAVFDEKMEILSKKLSGNTEKLDQKARESLVSEIDKLEVALNQHEQRVIQTQSNYRVILATLKKELLNVKELEEKLTALELQRLSEREAFQKRMLMIAAVIVALLLLIALFVFLIQKLRKQKIELIDAHCAIRLVNDNLEDLVQQRTLSLEKAYAEMDTFFYKASHNLRRPVRSIIGLSNIAKHSTPSEVIELFDRTGHTASDMDHLLLRLQRISEINYPSDYSTITLCTLVDDAYRSVLKSVSNPVRFINQCDSTIAFECYPHVLRSILIGLLENAVFFSGLKTNSSAEVSVKAWRVDDTLYMDVTDNGIGIDSEILDTMYTMFFVGHEASKGDGLGLYIVSKGLSTLGGSVRVETQPGEYTRFCLTIPLTRSIASSQKVFSRPVDSEYA